MDKYFVRTGDCWDEEVYDSYNDAVAFARDYEEAEVWYLHCPDNGKLKPRIERVWSNKE